MKWFKHYSDASRGDLLSKINREFGLAGEARWWRLIELMAERYPVDHDCFSFTSELLRRSMSFRSQIDLESFLDRLQIHSGLIVNKSGNDYELTYSKLAEIKDNYTKDLQDTSKKLSIDKNRTEQTRTEQNRTDKNINKKNSKKKKNEDQDGQLKTFQIVDQLKDLPTIQEFLQHVPEKVQTKWLEYWPKWHIRHEIEKALRWLVANPKKKKSDYGRFMTNWLNKSMVDDRNMTDEEFENHRLENMAKGVGLTKDELLKFIGADEN